MSWLKIKRPGRVRKYMLKKYGWAAFTKDGKLKVSYLKRAYEEAKDPSLRKAIMLAITMKTKWRKR